MNLSRSSPGSLQGALASFSVQQGLERSLTNIVPNQAPSANTMSLCVLLAVSATDLGELRKWR